ncbi:MAG: 30S ribosome-binding factor RbfA [Gemmatimonadetes bacterium]|nr:30S ribosome-binding factor RbfA [Gemmatimonadota bacterium]
MKEQHRRSERVAEAIREEVATLLAEGVRDPRVSRLVTVTSVEVTRDLRHATVYVSVLGDDKARTDTLAGLADLGGHLRGRVGRALQLRSAPTFAFKYDDSIQRAARIDALLAQVREPAPPKPDGDA